MKIEYASKLWKPGMGLLFVMMTFFACGGGGDGSGSGAADPSRSSRYVATQAPGDVWSWTITITGDTGTFRAVNETLGFEYAGDAVRLPNGFLRLSVTYATDPDATAGDQAYALEFPDTALIIKPSGDDPVIVGAAQGACPTGNATYNWVQLVDAAFDAALDQAYGVSFSTVTGLDFDFSHAFYLLDGTALGTGSSLDFTCNDGRLTRPGDPQIIAVTPSGLMITDNGPGAGGIVGMQTPSSPVDLNDLVAAGREFRGVVFKAGAGSDEETEAVWTRSDGGGFTAGNYDDFEAGIETSTPTIVTLGAQNSPGVITATQYEGTNGNPLVLMVNRINGRYFLYGVGTGLPHHPGENFLVIEQ